MVPDEISEWKPEIAPHAMVMKAKGKTLPAKIGPVPSVNRVSAGSSICGRSATNSHGEREHDADLDERAQVVARREQQPNRDHRSQEAVGDDHRRELGAVEREPRGERRVAIHQAAPDQRQGEQHEADKRRFAHRARS